MARYNFYIGIGFRVEADTEYDAMQAALATEQSLNEAGIRSSRGSHAHVIRHKAPELRGKPRGILRRTNQAMPEFSAVNTRSNWTELVDQFRKWWVVTLHPVASYDIADRTYRVKEPTEERAIEAARLKLSHETSHRGSEVVEVELVEGCG